MLMNKYERMVRRMIEAMVALFIALVLSMVFSCMVSHAAEADYEVYEDVPLDAATQKHTQKVCDQYDMSYEFVLALMQSESNFKAEAAGDKGRSIGYMQINKVNWKRMKDIYGLDVHDPLDNITAGVIILHELAEKYDDPYEILICYKAGEGRGKKLYEKGVYKCKSYDVIAICDTATAWEEAHNK